jgi:hypothetical protein
VQLLATCRNIILAVFRHVTRRKRMPIDIYDPMLIALAKFFAAAIVLIAGWRFE